MGGDPAALPLPPPLNLCLRDDMSKRITGVEADLSGFYFSPKSRPRYGFPSYFVG